MSHSRPLPIIIIFRHSIYWYTEFLNQIFSHYENNMQLDEEEKIIINSSNCIPWALGKDNLYTDI